MILIDYNQVSINAVLSAFAGESLVASDDNISAIRHLVLSSLVSYKKKFKEFGDLVICCDSKNYWRREIFPFYKGDRKRNREKSKVDWKFLSGTLDTIKQDIKDNFRFKVIEVDRAEADDIVAILCKWSQENYTTQIGMMDKPKDILIISEDMDFFQLQKYKNIKQWAPRKCKYISPDVPLREFVIEHIVKASDDAIPNILSNDNCIAEQIRQTSIKKEYLQKFLEKGRNACETDQEKRNWNRNQRLIDFDFIPPDIEKSIVDTYIEYEISGSKSKIMSYLSTHRCKQLFEHIGEF